MCLNSDKLWVRNPRFRGRGFVGDSPWVYCVGVLFCFRNGVWQRSTCKSRGTVSGAVLRCFTCPLQAVGRASTMLGGEPTCPNKDKEFGSHTIQGGSSKRSPAAKPERNTLIVLSCAFGSIPPNYLEPNSEKTTIRVPTSPSGSFPSKKRKKQNGAGLSLRSWSRRFGSFGLWALQRSLGGPRGLGRLGRLERPRLPQRPVERDPSR